MINEIMKELQKPTASADVESFFQFGLAEAVGGVREIKTPAGVIDILSDDLIIEVKSCKSWKHAIGQILVYGHYYPSKTKLVALFGNVSDARRKLIETHCKQLSIGVIWLGDMAEEDQEKRRINSSNRETVRVLVNRAQSSAQASLFDGEE
jgi:hypothetical protein